MVFTSITFLFYFLPIFLICYFITPGNRWKNAVTLAFSLGFYGWGEPWFIGVLIGSVLLNSTMGRIIGATEGTVRRNWLAATVAANLLLLGIFKYAGFAVSNFNSLTRPFGVEFGVPELPLPLGISFFTFHCLSYVIDIYRRRFPPNRSLVDVALYISLFPQLVAGPIVRYKTVARQLRLRRHTWHLAAAGSRIAIIGMAQKVLIADQVAPLAHIIFDYRGAPTLVESWLGLIAYTVQIYFDFAGYSNVAIGLGLVLGFSFPRNFRLPYTSRSITEFWRRWHMSLSAWLRDYLYIPLGGSRGSTRRTYQNLMTVFVLCGLWHGASWNFVLWGVWHGGFLIIERGGMRLRLARAPAAIRWSYTMLAVMGGWVLFRTSDLGAAKRYFAGLVGANGFDTVAFAIHPLLSAGVLGPLCIGIVLAVVPRPVPFTALRLALPPGVSTAYTFCLFGLVMVTIAAGTFSPFLYFRF